jgi:hypothetical protein
MLKRYVASILLCLSGMIGIVEAAEQCPAGTVPVLNRSLGGVPYWDGCVASQRGNLSS